MAEEPVSSFLRQERKVGGDLYFRLLRNMSKFLIFLDSVISFSKMLAMPDQPQSRVLRACQEALFEDPTKYKV